MSELEAHPYATPVAQEKVVLSCAVPSLSNSATPVTTPTIEEGGLDGWTTVFGAFLGLFATFGQLNSFGSYQAYYSTHQLAAYSASEISWIGSLQLWTFFFSGLFVGRLFDAYGPKRLILLGTVLLTISLMMTSLCIKYYQFILTQGILLGIGTGLVFYPCVSSTQTHFNRLRATASSIAVSGSSVGGIVFPIMLQALFPKAGFEWTVRITGFVSLGCCLLAFVCCTTRLAPRKPGPILDIASLRDIKFMTFALGLSIVCFGLYVPFFYVAQYAEQKIHTSTSRSFEILAVMNAGSFLGRPIPGILADVFGRYNLMIPSTAISGVLCITLWLLADDFASIISFAALYGFFSGALVSLTPPCIAQISEPSEMGGRIGLAYTLMSFSSLVGTPIAGAILAKQHGSYGGLIVFTGASLLVGAVAMSCVRVMISPKIAAKI